MAWTATNPVSIGDPTKKSHYDNVFDNTSYLKDAREDTDGNSSAIFSADDTYTINIAGNDAVIVDTSGTGVMRAKYGIQPNANAYAAAEVLDDYEEGTYTLAMTCSTSGTITLNSTKDIVAYTKVGRVVHIQGTIEVASRDAPTGDLRFSLPFATANLPEYAGQASGGIAVSTVDFTGNYLTVVFTESLSYFFVYEIVDNGGWSILTGGDIPSGANQFSFNFSYIA